MKKKIFIILVVILIIIIVILIPKKPKPFYLENDYYGNPNITEINFDELDNLITNKESFVIFIYQTRCTTSTNFEKVLSDFVNDTKISIYKIPFTSIKDTPMRKFIKYYPSFIIYHNGKVVDYLEADKDEDVKYYTKKEDFKSWFTKYIKLKD